MGGGYLAGPRVRGAVASAEGEVAARDNELGAAEAQAGAYTRTLFSST